jgi:hydrogenase maturation protein HypF
VDATDEGAVRRLRWKKGREEKPLAVMVEDLGEARKVGRIEGGEEELLLSPERPIVLVSKGEGSRLAPAVAPGLDRVGIMLPYTPLHHLLMEEAGRPLVMTSGNLSEEPIVTENAQANERLGALADGSLLHDREVVNRCDDSVVRLVDGLPLFHRRARGFAPLSIPMPVATARPLLAVGPHLKNTFALARDRDVYVSQHIGDLENLETLEHFRSSLDRFRELFRIEPEVIVRDLHPGYLSTRVARELAESMGSVELVAVQHHHAHVAAVLAEHGETGPAVGLAFDGTGYGDDGYVWGGEILVADLGTYRRRGRLRYIPLPGSEAAIRAPWRTVLGCVALAPDSREDFRLAFEGVPETGLEVALRQAEAGFNAPLASSMGRLFDAAAAVLGLRNRSAYDGQAAIELEAAAGGPRGGEETGGGEWLARKDTGISLPYQKESEGLYVMDPIPLLSALGRGRLTGDPLPKLARAFHAAVARTGADLAEAICREEGLETVVLCGGVFQNALLLTATRTLLEGAGLRVLAPRLLSPNDGAISYGQAAVAAAILHFGKGG